MSFSFYLALERKNGEKREENGEKREENGEKVENSKLLASIYGVLLIGIRRANSESLSTRRGLRVGAKKDGFHRRSKGVDFGKSKFSR